MFAQTQTEHFHSGLITRRIAILDENDMVQNMHDFCVCVFVYVAICSRDERRVAVRVHFIVWGRSPVLKGALY